MVFWRTRFVFLSFLSFIWTGCLFHFLCRLLGVNLLSREGYSQTGDRMFEESVEDEKETELYGPCHLSAHLSVSTARSYQRSLTISSSIFPLHFLQESISLEAAEVLTRLLLFWCSWQALWFLSSTDSSKTRERQKVRNNKRSCVSHREIEEEFDKDKKSIPLAVSSSFQRKCPWEMNRDRLWILLKFLEDKKRPEKLCKLNPA